MTLADARIDCSWKRVGVLTKAVENAPLYVGCVMCHCVPRFGSPGTMKQSASMRAARRGSIGPTPRRVSSAE